MLEDRAQLPHVKIQWLGFDSWLWFGQDKGIFIVVLSQFGQDKGMFSVVLGQFGQDKGLFSVVLGQFGQDKGLQFF